MFFRSSFVLTLPLLGSVYFSQVKAVPSLIEYPFPQLKVLRKKTEEPVGPSPSPPRDILVGILNFKLFTQRETSYEKVIGISCPRISLLFFPPNLSSYTL